MKYFIIGLALIGLVSAAGAQESNERWSPSQDLKSMQGKWRIDQDRSVFATKTALDSIVAEPSRQFSTVHVDSNRLSLDDNQIEFLFTNDLRIDGVKMLEDHRLICLVAPGSEGRAYLGSYRIKGDTLEIRYPHTCHCTRTGKILCLTRVKE